MGPAGPAYRNEISPSVTRDRVVVGSRAGVPRRMGTLRDDEGSGTARTGDTPRRGERGMQARRPGRLAPGCVRRAAPGQARRDGRVDGGPAMAQELDKGDHVSWKSHGGTAE